MTATTPDTVDNLILDRLADADLPEEAKDLVFAALEGHDALTAALGGAQVQRPAPEPATGPAPEPVGTYLGDVTVTGFRGIGPKTTLPLVPGPGLTIVTGRNGSGKSSFAEAVEYALTGNNKRWSGRSVDWQGGWRNLHTDEPPAIRVQLGIEGNRQGAVVGCDWPTTGDLKDATTFLQLKSQPRQSVDHLGWNDPLEYYRPILSYSELGNLLHGSPTEMHDSLHKILGLGRLSEIEKLLKAARKDADQQRKLAKEQLPALRELVAAHPDPRARHAERELAAKVPDLDQLAQLADPGETADAANVAPLRQLTDLQPANRDALATDVERLRAALEQIEKLAGTPAEEARALAALLRAALHHHTNHPDQSCPVCGGRTLDQDWAGRTQRELDRLTRRAEQLDAAHTAVRDARRALHQRIPAVPAVLTADVPPVATGDARVAWQHLVDLVTSDDLPKIVASALDTFDALQTALAPVRDTAQAELDRRRHAWQPVADQLRDWVATAHAFQLAREQYGLLRKAVDWLVGEGDRIRHDRLAPVAERATEIWNMLRQDSSVDLRQIRLTGTGTSRRLDLGVAIDGRDSKALGVMSQGELHSLALALFLPRATLPASPFRFLLIDDPVQAMDPTKVYGLAQLLADEAQQRQVVVFTHDDRLPTAVRQLGLKARILVVDRLVNSQVDVHDAHNGAPAQRYLRDARALLKDEHLTSTVQTVVVCHLLRQAIEATSHDLIRTEGFRKGTPVPDTEAAISATEGLRGVLALALGVEQNVLKDRLNRISPSAHQMVTVVNKGAHGNPVQLANLIGDAERLVKGLEQLRQPTKQQAGGGAR